MSKVIIYAIHRRPAAAVCNLCGRPLSGQDLAQHISIDKRLGYGSVHDLEHVRIKLCCQCLDTIIDACAVDPIVEP